jgi:hypothetical protein
MLSRIRGKPQGEVTLKMTTTLLGDFLDKEPARLELLLAQLGGAQGANAEAKIADLERRMAPLGAYNGRTVANPKPELVGRYEAALTQASYMSRLAYEKNSIKLGGIQLLNTNPIIFNTGLSLIKTNIKNIKKAGNAPVVSPMKFIGPGSVIYKRLGYGQGSMEAPCHFQLLDYTNYECGCPYPGERVLYITFRGTASLKSALTDLKVGAGRLDKLLKLAELGGVSASAVFAEAGVDFNEKGFQAHAGFVSNVALIMPEICAELKSYLTNSFETDAPIHRILITGHSLGGAKASLLALVLAGFKRANIPLLQPTSIHCISFGAPKVFLDYSRNVFNDLLIDGYLTLDRVANRADNTLSFITSSALGIFGQSIDAIPQYPPGPYVHPGFMVLKTETRTQTTSGRSRNITDIREMFGGIVSGKGLGFNGLPDYLDFFKSFDTVKSLNSVELYKSKIHRALLGMVYKTPLIANPIYDEIKTLANIIVPITSEPTEKSLAAAANAEGEAAKVVQDSPPPGSEGNEDNEGNDGTIAGGGKYTNMYKQETLNQGPNHVVYMCEKNISPGICHSGYMGVSYMGVMSSFGTTFENGHFMLENKQMKYIILDSFGPLSGTNVTGGTRKRRQRRRRAHTHRRRGHLRPHRAP